MEEFTDKNGVIDLIKKTQGHTKEEALKWMKDKDIDLKTTDEITIGSIIEFTGGYHNDIRYKSEVIGIDLEGNLYLMWDCYWFSIRPNDKRRNILKLN